MNETPTQTATESPVLFPLFWISVLVIVLWTTLEWLPVDRVEVEQPAEQLNLDE